MEELDPNKGSSEAENEPTAPSQASEEQNKSARVDAAKAFFRAMYAGDEPAESFGQAEPKADSATQTKCRNCEALESALKEADQKTTEAETLYKRMAADFDNYRRRMEREREEAVSLGVKKAAETLLPALDDLDRAMMFLNADTPAEKLLESVKLVGNRVLSCMEQIGVRPIDAVGQLFDPKYHEPVQQIETTEHPDGTVVQELRRGYTLNDRVVRPALVNVASNSLGYVQSAQPEEANQSEQHGIPEMEIIAEEPATNEGAEEPKVFDLGDSTDV